jgi:restriction endonuclease S subunit
MECFVINSNEIEGRINPFYYKPEFKTFDKKISSGGKFEIKEIKDISKVICGPFGSSIKLKDYKGEGVPLIRISNIEEDHLSKEDVVYISKELSENLKSYIVKNGDLIISQRGTLGLTVKVDEIFDGAVMSANFIAIKDLREVSPDFLQILLSSEFGQIQLLRKTSGQVQTKITTNDIKTIKIPIIPEKIQSQIVDEIKRAYKHKAKKESEAQRLLDSINGYVLDELGIKLPELKDKKYYAVNSADLERRLDPYYYQPKFNEVNKALHKSVYKIKALKKFITKIHYGVSIKNIYVDEGIPLIRICNLKSYKIDLSEVVKLPESFIKEIGNGFVYEGDILISRSGSVGIVAVVPKEADGFAFGSFMIKFCLNNEINKEYVAIWLNNRLSHLFTEREKIGAIQGNITIPTIEDFRIPYPSFEIQNKIAEEVKARMQKAEQLQKEAKEELEKAKKEVEKIILGE